jgi:hypothetical protein
MNSKLYDRLKFIAQILLPALGTLYAALAAIWGLPAVEEVTGTVLAVDTFLGGLLHLSAASYSGTAKGTLAVQETEQGKLFHLELDGDPEYDLEGKDRVVFKVEKRPKQ